MSIKFQDLTCWQKAFELTDAVYTATNNLRDFTLKDQLRRAAVSTMNNIAEGFGRFHTNDRIRFFEYTTSSCLEIESMTYILEKQKILDPDTVTLIRKLSIDTYKVTAGFSTHLKSKNSKIQ